MQKGDVLRGAKRSEKEARHFIVYLEGNDDNSFIGAVLTHSSKHQDNYLMEESHFKKADASGKEYEINFNNTHVVGRKFFKPNEWGPFNKIGELTQEGIEFVEKVVSGHNPILWDDYIK